MAVLRGIDVYMPCRSGYDPEMTPRLPFLAALAVLLIVPTAAAANPDSSVMQFRLPASNGYTMQVKTEGEQTAVSLWRGDPKIRATYYAADSALDGAIDASFGALGHIDVRFQPSEMTELVQIPRGQRPVPGCRQPHRLRRRLGTFTGTISFAGEDAYASVAAAQAHGSVGPSARPRCGGGATASSLGVGAYDRAVEHVWAIGDAILMNRSLASPENEDSTLLLASAAKGLTRFGAYRVEIPAPGLAVTREVEVNGPYESFAYDHGLQAATLRPPAPFSGEARFSGRRRRLSGNLTVEFPGLAPQRLTGGDFEARISSIR